jgi:hypothetical protein
VGSSNPGDRDRFGRVQGRPDLGGRITAGDTAHNHDDPLPGTHQSGSAAVFGHASVTDATDWALRNVTRWNFTDVFPQVSGLDGTERHHSAWWFCNIKWKPNMAPDYA